MGLLKDAYLSSVISVKNHDLISKFRNYCFYITLIYFNRCCPQVYLGDVGLYNFSYLTFFIVKNWVYIFMRLDFDCNSFLYPLNLLFFVRIISFFLELFIQLLNFIHLLFIEAFLLFGLLFKLFCSIKC